MPGGLTAIQHRNSLLLIGTCAFANNGAGNGAITALAVQFVADDGTRWTFLPYKLLDDAERFTDSAGHQVIAIDKAPAFSSIVLPGKQTARHTIGFLADEFEDLAPHKFHVKLLRWSDGEPKPREQQLSTLDINVAVVSGLQTQSINGLPFEEQRQRMKELK